MQFLAIRLFVPLLVFLRPVFSFPVSSGSYPLKLLNLFVSHGSLNPAFRPDVLDYTVTMAQADESIAVTPEIDNSLPEYQGGNLPVVTMDWSPQTTSNEAIAAPLRGQIDLPEDGGKLTVYIKIAHPRNLYDAATYSVTVYQAQNDKVVGLKSLQAVDDSGSSVLCTPQATPDTAVYHAYINPRAASLTLQARCSDGNWMKINGRTASSTSGVVLARDKSRYQQLIDVTCGHDTDVRHYVVSVMSDWKIDEIPVPSDGTPTLFCQDKEGATFHCPNPKDRDYRTQITGFVDPTIRYTVESSDNSVRVRLLNQVATVPFSYVGVGQLSLAAHAGQATKVWTLYFKGAPSPGVLRILGWFLGIVLLLLLVSLMAVLGISNTLGIGAPLGATEVATAMTLMLQFFCFASMLRGVSILGDMVDAMKWVTLFWPLPWTMTVHSNNFERMGDVSDIHNAYGCLLWSALVMLAVVVFHGVVIWRLRRDASRTFPHSMKFGHWEQRVLHWICFPVCTACAMILKHPESDLSARVLAGGMVTLFAAWGIGAFIVVKSRISERRVVWVWHSSLREDGELEDEAGYWSDVFCDQLLTQPVNRSLMKWWFPWRWSATVADIETVNICPRMFARGHDGDSELHPVTQYARGHREPAYPLGKNPRTVDVIQTVSPNRLCPGQRLISGLLRTSWLDVLFTYRGLSQFYSSVNRDSGGDLVVPLTVKTCQLRGPLTGGVNHLFFDGARIPFIRIGDTLYRMLTGVLLGLSLGSDSYSLDAGVFGSIGVVSTAFMAYHIFGRPYSRSIENWLIAVLTFTVSCTSFSFMGYALQTSNASTITDVFLWLACVTSLVLAGFAGIVIFMTYSAVVCPPLEETRFLEELANCNVTIADHDNAWAVEVPAYNKLGASDLKAQCSITKDSKLHVSIYPSGEDVTLEFSSQEMTDACRCGALRPPVLSLFSPDPLQPLGYRHINVYGKETLHGDVAGFLAVDPKLRYMADSLARNIAHQVTVRGKGKSVICMTVIPPKNPAVLQLDTDPRHSMSVSRHGELHSRSKSKYGSVELAYRS